MKFIENILYSVINVQGRWSEFQEIPSMLPEINFNENKWKGGWLQANEKRLYMEK